MKLCGVCNGDGVMVARKADGQRIGGLCVACDGVGFAPRSNPRTSVEHANDMVDALVLHMDALCRMVAAPDAFNQDEREAVLGLGRSMVKQGIAYANELHELRTGECRKRAARAALTPHSDRSEP